ncbi:MAG: translocation/assembly module TamB domain-containing protein, partial [Prevotella sp.]|nr:translocation/assembly module TamB domain-containing protein [Prevotella sp.]
MKLLRRVLVFALWGLLLSYAVLLTAVRLPQVQTRIARTVAVAISELLDTEVAVGRVDLGFLNRVIIDSLRVNDRQGQTMLRAGRLTARIEPLPLLEGKVSLSSAQLFGAQLRLYQSVPDSASNFQFVLDALASEDTTHHTPLHLHIGSVIVRNVSAEWHQTYKARRPQGVLDPAHLCLSGISAYVRLNHLTDSTLSIDLRRLAFREASGLDVRKLALSATVTPTSACVSNMALLMPRSSLTIDSLTATYRSSGRLFAGIDLASARAQLTMTHSVLTPADLTPLLPQMHTLTDSVTISASMSIDGHDLHLHHIDIGGPLTLHATGGMTLPADSSRQPLWRADIERLSLSRQWTEALGQAAGAAALAQRTGAVSLRGALAGTIDHAAEGRLDVASDAGRATVEGSLGRDGHVNVTALMDNIDLRRLTGNDLLGTMSGRLRGSGQLDSRHPDLSAKADISSMELNGYTYRNLSLSGRYSHRGSQADISIDDPNLQLTVGASAQGLPSAHADMQLTAYIAHAYPYALHLSRQGEGYIVERVHLNASQHAGNRLLNVTAPEGNIHINGHFDIAHMPQTLAALVCDRLPVLSDLLGLETQPSDDSFSLSAQLNDTRWLNDIFQIPLSIEQTINLWASVDATRGELSLLALLPNFSYSGTRYSDAKLSLTSPADSLLLNAQLTRHDDNDMPLDLSVSTQAADSSIATTLTWDDRQALGHYGGQVSATTLLGRTSNGTARATVYTAPSMVVMKDAPWQLLPATVTYTDRRIEVERLALEHEGQHIIIDGTATDSDSDTLRVDLHDIDVSYILDMVNFHSVEFDGQATGTATLTAPFATPQAQASLSVSQFRFERGRMGTLYATARWNNELQQIDINATAADQPEAMTFISGYVSPARNYIDLGIRAENTRIDFMQSFTESFLSHTSGHATGSVRLAGDLGEMDLTGQLYVTGQSHVDALGTTFTLPGDTVRLVTNDILLDRVRLADRQGNTAHLSGGIHHDHLSDLTFDLDVAADEPVLAYHFPTNSGQDLFWGTVMARGRVDMHGRPGEVTINIDATPTRGTAFTYNAAQNGDIASQEFIHWASRPAATTPHDVAATPQPPVHRPGSDLRLNFRINATPEAEILLLMDANTGDIIKLRGEGIMRATYYNKGTFQLFGTYRVESGTYGITIQNIIKKDFTFLPGGTIVFGGQPMQAALNLRARHQVPGVSLSDLDIGSNFASSTQMVNCLMDITGQASAPQVNFDLDLPNVNADEQQMVRSLIN